jgi:hypothetical protein
MDSSFLLKLEMAFSQTLISRESLQERTKGNVLKAYFIGKDEALIQAKKIFEEMIILSPDEFSILKDEWVLKGFEQGKSLMKNNFKVWLDSGLK